MRTLQKTMANYRRYFVAGGTYFFTVVTAGRAPILCTPTNRPLLRAAFRNVRIEMPFRLDAIVLLPDHLHAIWTLPSGDADYATRWGKIKKHFTQDYLAAGGRERSTPNGQARQRRRGVWQRRFWEHVIGDEDDFERHFDYVHYNPVKHGYVASPRDWPYSSFHRWVRRGVYERHWGAAEKGPIRFDGIEKTAGE